MSAPITGSSPTPIEKGESLPEVHHAATAGVVRLITALSEHMGWLTTSELAARADLDRNVVRRMALQLAEAGWVQRAAHEEGDRWALGVTLPHVGLAYQRRLVAQAEALRAQHDQLLAPIKEVSRG